MNMKKEAAEKLAKHLPGHPTPEDFLRVGVETGLVPPKALRDFLIREEFQELTAAGTLPNAAYVELCDKHNLSKPTVIAVVGGTR